MSAALQARAEITKLARLMGTDAAELAYLEEVPPDDVARFRDQLTDAMFAGDRVRLQRVATAARVVPGQVSAAIAQRALGPVICARLAGLIEPDKAADIAKRLPIPFLTDVAIAIDPRRASAVIAKIAPKKIGEVAAELAAREESVTLGRFVAFVSDDALREALPRIGEATLLRTAFVMEGKERLDHVVSLLAPERLAAVIRIAEEDGLWQEALDLLGYVGEQRLVALRESLTEEDRARLDAKAHELGLTERLGPLAGPAS